MSDRKSQLIDKKPRKTMHRLMKISKRIGLILNGRWFLRQLIIASIRPFDFHFFFSSEIDSVFLFAFFSVDFCCCCWYCLFQFDRNALALHILSLYRSSLFAYFCFARSFVCLLCIYSDLFDRNEIEQFHFHV